MGMNMYSTITISIWVLYLHNYFYDIFCFGQFFRTKQTESLKVKISIQIRFVSVRRLIFCQNPDPYLMSAVLSEFLCCMQNSQEY